MDSNEREKERSAVGTVSYVVDEQSGQAEGNY